MNYLVKQSQAELALKQGDATSARRHAEEMLLASPTNLAAKILHAQALTALGMLEQAFEELGAILRLDPENPSARLGLRIAANKKYEKTGHTPKGLTRADAQHRLDLANLYSQQGRYDLALREFDEAERRGAETIVCDLGRCEVLWHQGKSATAMKLGREILKANPEAIKPKLILSALLGKTNEAKFYHQQAAIQDASGIVVARLFGTHAISQLDVSSVTHGVPDESTPIELAEADLSEADERDVEDIARLKPPEPVEYESKPIVIDEREFNVVAPPRRDGEVERAVSGLTELARGLGIKFLADGGRRPLELIVSHQQRLLQAYDRTGFQQIDAKLKALAKAIRDGRELDAEIVYLDSLDSMRAHGVETLRGGDWQEMNRVLASLLMALEASGHTVDSILFVGGEHILPHAQVPNTVFDYDHEILTDALYVARGEQNLIPRYALGRLPDDPRDVKFLLRLLDIAIARHGEENQAKTPKIELHSFGLAADIWNLASREVYHQIRNGQDLRISPPYAASRLNTRESPCYLTYYNLHGLRDNARWFGQKGNHFYPALEPRDITPALSAQTVVFTEACYGAHILGKTSEDSIALRYLREGALGFVGSTAVSYGALELPLACADVLGWHFWSGVKSGLSIGRALVEAKLAFAREAMDKIGFLGGDDQKTLHSFVLYGDPSLHPVVAPTKVKAATVVWNELLAPNVQEERLVRLDEVPAELIRKSRAYLAKRMPSALEMPKAALSSSRVRSKGIESDAFVLAFDHVALSQGGQLDLRYTVRMILTPKGKLLKVAISK